MATPEDSQPDPAAAGRLAHLAEQLARLAGGSAVDGPCGLLAVEEERLAASAEAEEAETA
jgi:hypothetical protein